VSVSSLGDSRLKYDLVLNEEYRKFMAYMNGIVLLKVYSTMDL